MAMSFKQFLRENYKKQSKNENNESENDENQIKEADIGEVEPGLERNQDEPYTPNMGA